ncbi:MAG: hypothetical protein NZ518_04760, partial [Dehalococcoidia bacterium]|nr:hypothetical protein [Dehalococcoidia bacterium]
LKSEVFATVAGDTNGFVTGVRANFGCGRPLGSPPNAVFFCNAEFDRLMDQAYLERDPARRAQLFRQANAVLRQEAVLLPIIVQPS